MADWLERRDIDLHYDELMSQYGGLPGVPDEDALTATLARPQQLLTYEPQSTIFELAAAYGFGFARNHCFPDGNKRIALVSMDVFLMLNGFDLIPDEAETVVIINALAAGDYEQTQLAEWLEQNSTILPAEEL